MSTPAWTPDRPIEPALAARTIAAQFPELAGQPVRQIGAGWDNAVFGVGDEFVFRFIHRSTALEGSAAELAVLAALPPLPLPVPRPRFIGTPTPEVPWPFWGAPLLPGVEIAELDLGDDARELAASLGGFLRLLHAPEVAERVLATADTRGVRLRVDPWHRSSPADIVPRARATLARARAAGTLGPDPAVDGALAAAEHLGPPARGPVVVHGDLHIRHVLVVRGRVSGVIDWGDAGLGYPSMDLMIGYLAFTGAPRDAFLAAYGGVDDGTEARARALAIHLAAALSEQASADGMVVLGDAARAALARAAL